jgi:hypothetical protein
VTSGNCRPWTRCRTARCYVSSVAFLPDAEVALTSDDTPSPRSAQIQAIPTSTRNALRQWKLPCPKGELGLVFPNGAGNIELHTNIVHRELAPTLFKAGVLDANGGATYTGLHALRHFFASWCANRANCNGRRLPSFQRNLRSLIPPMR